MPRHHLLIVLSILFAVVQCVKKPESIKISNVVAISAGYYNSCSIQYQGWLGCWGSTVTGQGGFNGVDICTVQTIPIICAKRPGGISGLTTPGVLAATVGATHSCANFSGEGYCWGEDSFGQLGDGGNTLSYSALQVSGFTANVTALSAGFAHTCGLQNSGAFCWGDNSVGELGDSTNNDSNTPVAVTGLAAGVMKVASGTGTSCAVLASGAAMCWGINTSGQLGDGTAVPFSNAPVMAIAANATDIASAVADNPGHTCALVSGGVKCWGLNTYGQLGDGTVLSRNTPTDVVGLTSGVSAIAVGGNHTCALKDGGVKCWGKNASGQLGNSTDDLCIDGSGVVSCSLSPVSVISLDRNMSASDHVVSAIAAGNEHSCALLDDQTMMCWGDNSAGQLGNNSVAPSLVPTPVYQ